MYEQNTLPFKCINYRIFFLLTNDLVLSSTIFNLRLYLSAFILIAVTYRNHFFDDFLVRGSKPGKTVNLTESEIKNLCIKSRDVFLSQPILLELEAPLKVCGWYLSCYLILSMLFILRIRVNHVRIIPALLFYSQILHRVIP